MEGEGRAERSGSGSGRERERERERERKRDRERELGLPPRRLPPPDPPPRLGGGPPPTPPANAGDAWRSSPQRGLRDGRPPERSTPGCGASMVPEWMGIPQGSPRAREGAKCKPFPPLPDEF